MKLEPVKSYKQMQYPTLEEIQNEKELLTKPLNKWKKMGITCVMLMALLGTNLQAVEEEVGINNKILLNDIAGGIVYPDPIIPEIIDSALLTRKDFLVQEVTNKVFLEEDIEDIIELFIDWLFMQGVL